MARLVDELGHGQVAQVCDVFVADAGDVVASVRGACESGDADAAARAAHRLKSGSGFVGALGLSSLCAEIEDLARHGRLDEVGSRIDVLAAEVERVSGELTALTDRRRP